MKQNQPQLPFVPGPIDFSQPVQFRFSQLQAVHAAAARAGWRMVRLTVLAGAYEAHFMRDGTMLPTEGGNAPTAPAVRRAEPLNINHGLAFGLALAVACFSLFTLA